MGAGWPLLVFAALVVAGCTAAPAAPPQAPSAPALGDPVGPDTCACAPVAVGCPDGSVASCQPACAEGGCIPCEPTCPPSLPLACNATVLTCPDGTVASCANSWQEGACTTCVPDCPACAEVWDCGGWGACEQGVQARSCTDRNHCGTRIALPEQQRECWDRILFFEVVYDPFGTESKEEWFTLWNPTAAAADLAGWTVSDQSGNWTFPNATLPAGGYLHVARDAAAFQARYGCAAVDGFTRGLNNDGDSLTLRSGGVAVDSVGWEQDAWPASAGNGKSIRRQGKEWLSEQEPAPCGP